MAAWEATVARASRSGREDNRYLGEAEGALCIVDYAHKPEALGQARSIMSPLVATVRSLISLAFQVPI